MVSFAEALQNEVARLACRVLSDPVAGPSYAERAVRRIPGANQALDRLDATREFARRVACGVAGPDPRPGDNLGGPNDGQPGQCPGVGYDVEAVVQCRYSAFAGEASSFDYTVTYQNTVGTGAIPGPIEGLVLPGVATGGLLSNRVPPVQISSNGGEQRFLGHVAISTSANRNKGNNQAISLVSMQITRRDGQPDNCRPGYDSPSYRGPLTYDDDGVERTDDVEIDLDDPVQDGPSITIPFFYVDPDLELRPEIELEVEPELNFNPGGGGELEIQPGSDNTSSEPDAPQDFGQEGNIVGAVVVSKKVTTFQTTTELRDETAPTLFLPRCATLLFGLRVGNNRAWTVKQDCSTLVQYLDVPGDIPAFTWKVIPSLGFSCEVYPVRKQAPIDVAEEVS